MTHRSSPYNVRVPVTALPGLLGAGDEVGPGPPWLNALLPTARSGEGGGIGAIPEPEGVGCRSKATTARIKASIPRITMVRKNVGMTFASVEYAGTLNFSMPSDAREFKPTLSSTA